MTHGKIISLSGRIGSGKDTAAEILVEHGFVHESFASVLKDACSAIFGWDRVMLEGKTPEARNEREQIDIWWAKRLNLPQLSPRWILQYLGTDVLRCHFHNDIWIAALEKKLQSHIEQGHNVVISDARFVNELTMLANKGATTVCVSRGEPPVWWEIAKRIHSDPGMLDFMLKTANHRSEWDWAGYQFDVELDNNGTLDELSTLVRTLLP